MVERRKTCVFVGSSGRIGRLLRTNAAQEAFADLDMHWQFRSNTPHSEDCFLWPDLSESQPLRKLAERLGGIDAICVFSGVSRGDKSDIDAMREGTEITRRALMSAYEVGIPKILIASSSSVYGLRPEVGLGTPFAETDPCAPANAYGRAKYEAEQALIGKGITHLRIGNVAGADALLQQLANGPLPSPLPLDIYPDGDGPRRSYISPVSLAMTMAALMRTDKQLPPVLNVASLHPVSMKSLLDVVGQTYTERLSRDASHQSITLDCHRLSELVGAEVLNETAVDIVARWRASL